MEESSQLQSKPAAATAVVTGVSARRWWLLALLSVMSCQQSNNWSTFTVLYSKVQREYGWSSATINLLTMWGGIVYMPVACVTPALLSRINLRQCLTLSIGLVTAGAFLRCIFRDGSSTLCVMLAHLGQILNAVAAPLLLTTPSKLSAEWFPISERIFATTIAVTACYSGTLVCYATIYLFLLPRKMMSVLILLRLEFGVALFTLVVSVIDQKLFPDLPECPPSISQDWLRLGANQQSNHLPNYQTNALLTQSPAMDSESEKNKDWYSTLKSLSFRNEPNLHYFSLLYGCYGGMISGYSAILTPIFASNSINLSQTTIGLVGMVMIGAIIVGSVVFSYIQDIFQSKMTSNSSSTLESSSLTNKKTGTSLGQAPSSKVVTKWFMVGLVSVSGLCLLLFSFLILEYSKKNSSDGSAQVLLGAALIILVIGSVLNAGTYGLGYEIAVELVFPRFSEVTASALLTLYFNLFSTLVIIFNIFIPPFEMLFIAPIMTILCGIGFLFYRPINVRAAMDSGQLHSLLATAAEHPRIFEVRKRSDRGSSILTNATSLNSIQDTTPIASEAGVSVALSSEDGIRTTDSVTSPSISRGSRQISNTAPLSLGEYMEMRGEETGVRVARDSGSDQYLTPQDSLELNSSDSVDQLINPQTSERDVWS